MHALQELKLHHFLKYIYYHLVLDPYRHGDFVYLIPNHKMSWQEASNYCNSLGGNLTSIKDQNESYVIRRVIFHYRAQKIDSFLWIGLNDIRKEGEYVWTDGTVSSFRNWQPNQPDNFTNEDCVHIRRDYDWKWNDLKCGEKIMLMCKIKGKNTVY